MTDISQFKIDSVWTITFREKEALVQTLHPRASKLIQYPTGKVVSVQYTPTDYDGSTVTLNEDGELYMIRMDEIKTAIPVDLNSMDVLWFSYSDQYTSSSMPQGAFTTLEAAREAKGPYHRIYKGKLNQIGD